MNSTARAADHPVVRATLEEAGWTEQYRDPTDWESWMRSETYSVVPGALQVLAEMGGLTLHPPRSRYAVYGTGLIAMDPWTVTGESPRIKDREEQLGLKLGPVGEWCDYYRLLVADDGSVIAEEPSQILRIGTDWADALRRIVVADSHPEQIGE